MHVGVSCRGLGAWKNPHYLVYFTAAEISKTSLAPSSRISQLLTGRLVSQAEFQSFMATFTEITEKRDSDWC